MSDISEVQTPCGYKQYEITSSFQIIIPIRIVRLQTIVFTYVGAV
jgi:hypothetical protein